ncbi:hypothetical protein HZS_387 [Henneguya salminicola]|nr:hypothetical protein HZS_387 [Henneguya salminicola]
MDIYSSLTDTEIRNKLSDFGVSPGPITDTTRKLYISKLQKLEGKQSKNLNTSLALPGNDSNLRYSPRNISPRTRTTPIRHARKTSNSNKSPSVPKFTYPSMYQNDSPVVYRTPEPEITRTPLAAPIFNTEEDKMPYFTPKHNANSSYCAMYTENSEKIDDLKKAPLYNWSSDTKSLPKPEPKNLKKSSTISTEAKGYKIQSFMKSRLILYIAYFFLVPFAIALAYQISFSAVSIAKSLSLNLIYKTTVPLIAIAFLYFIYLIYKKYKIRKQKHTVEIYTYVDKICFDDNLLIIKISKPTPPIYLLTIINKTRLWNDVCNFVCANESRIRTEVQTIAGQQFRVWKWIGSPQDVDSVAESKTKRISPEMNVYVSLSSCLKVKFDNVSLLSFDKVADTFITTIKSYGGKILRSNKVKNKSILYVKLNSKEEAVTIFNRLNKSQLMGHLVSIRFITEGRYMERFD